MRLFLIFALCADLTAKCVLAEREYEVKRGVYPFMAFVYYPSKTVDGTGVALMRGAVLLRPDWLISSSLEDTETPLAFPKETLLARLGAVRIDSKFTFYEDEEEQEREIVQIARPQNYSTTEWWFADVSLLKTLFPFNITTAVAPAVIDTKPRNTDKNCIILIYTAPSGNSSEQKVLMQLSVEMLVPSPENCGDNFIKRSMMCAADTDEMKKFPNFCEGNSGGPLICENEVIAIQTYTHDCKPPHLYQSLNAWENLLICALEDKCSEEQCATICNVIHKDPIDVSMQGKITSDEVKLHSDEENPSTIDSTDFAIKMIEGRRLADHSIIPDNVITISNTEATTAVAAEIYNNTTEFVNSRDIETSDRPAPTDSEHREEEQDTRSTTPSILAVTFNSDAENSHLFKTMESENANEEYKSPVENSQQENPEPEKHKVRSAAAGPVQCSFDIMTVMLAVIHFK